MVDTFIYFHSLSPRRILVYKSSVSNFGSYSQSQMDRRH